MSVSEFKAKCLALLDEIGQQGGTITVTKRGRPLATVGRAKRAPWKSPAGIWAGKVKIVGDIVHAPSPEIWDALSRNSETVR
jgi:antitoxin (DNA-binding transcriptional repressor) of toxin-antitoxin stability system